MNKLVSKNPILRFKLGKKIIKASGGLDTGTLTGTLNGRNVTKKDGIWVYDDTNSPIAGKDSKKVIIKTSEKKQDYSFMKGETRLRTSDETLKLLDPKIQKYLQRQQALGFTAKPTKPVVKSDPVVKKQSVIPKSGWSYGFDRSKEGIGDIAAMQRKLKAEGYYADNENSRDDGKWGQSTENAYIRYLNKLKAMELPPEQQNPVEIISLPQIYLNDFALDKQQNYPSTTISRGQQLFNNITLRPEFKYGYNNYVNPFSISNFTLTSIPKYSFLKQGGQLVSRNPILRFKIRKGLLGLIFPKGRKNKEILNETNDFGQNVLTTIINKRSSNPFKTNETISLEVTYTPEGNDTVYRYAPSQYPWNSLYLTSNNWHTAGESLRRPLFEKLRDRFNYLDGRPRFRNFIKVAQ